jgi:hypothetical protein
MSEFVNYKKRSFTLPHGCKNLNDLLHYSQHGIEPGKWKARQDTAVGKLCDVGRFIDKLTRTTAIGAFLEITSTRDGFVVGFHHMPSEHYLRSFLNSENIVAYIEIFGGFTNNVG